MNAAALIVARYLLTHPTHDQVLRGDVIRYPDLVKWIREEFGVTPGERTILEARNLLVSLAQENQP